MKMFEYLTKRKFWNYL